MSKTEISKIDEDNNIFVVEVTKGSSGSKNISIPAPFCKFCGIKEGDLIKLKLLDKRKIKLKK